MGDEYERGPKNAYASGRPRIAPSGVDEALNEYIARRKAEEPNAHY